MATPRAKYSIMAVKWIAIQQAQAGMLGVVVQIAGSAPAAAWLSRSQIEHFARFMCATMRAFKRDMVPVADAPMDPVAFTRSDPGPSGRDWCRVGGPDICWQVLRSAWDVKWGSVVCGVDESCRRGVFGKS
jgi:hypothetical protein